MTYTEEGLRVRCLQNLHLSTSTVLTANDIVIQGDRMQVVADADIVVFDYATVADLATFEGANQLATGVQTVLVNGGVIASDGKLVLDAPFGRSIQNAQID